MLLVVVRPGYHGFDHRSSGTHPRVQRCQETDVKIVITEQSVSLRLIDGRGHSNSIEQCCIEECSLVEVFGVRRQTREGGFAQSSQFVGFKERLSSIFHLLPHAGTLRLRKILSRFYV